MRVADLAPQSLTLSFTGRKGVTMGFGRSWDVPDEFWMLWWRNRQLRRLIMRADVEPAGKGPRRQAVCT